MAAKGLRLATPKAPVYLVILQGEFIDRPHDETNLVRSGKRKRPPATPEATSSLAATLCGAGAPSTGGFTVRRALSGRPARSFIGYWRICLCPNNECATLYGTIS